MSVHRIINGDSKQMGCLPDQSIDLIVTSPPYPMIEMWDKMFIDQDASIKQDIDSGKGIDAFFKMHTILNRTWNECDRVLKKNGFICINIGDATRTIDNNFQLFSNHTQIINYFIQKRYNVLPDIHWRKQSNSPNKFMGSGMFPAGAYVTYEHEYILIFRKGLKRDFNKEVKLLRQKSAFFWEERNVWFSDLWEMKGTSQSLQNYPSGRDRSAAFPFEIPYRLVNMYSVEGDTILDPFVGLGTTNLACMAANRNSVGIEMDPNIAEFAKKNLVVTPGLLNRIIDARITRHLAFIESLPKEKRANCYRNKPHGFEVKTKQETSIQIDHLSQISANDDGVISCEYELGGSLLPLF